jgi:hypothetical protein
MLDQALGDDLRHRLGSLVARERRLGCQAERKRDHDFGGIGGRELGIVAHPQTIARQRERSKNDAHEKAPRLGDRGAKRAYHWLWTGRDKAHSIVATTLRQVALMLKPSGAPRRGESAQGSGSAPCTGQGPLSIPQDRDGRL